MPKQILIVDDERPIREMMAFSLRRSGFEVAEAQAADAALASIASIARRRPDIILLDWNLPKTSGLEFTRHVRSSVLARRIGIIMVTARLEEADRIEALDCGVDDYQTKPFSQRELLARIHAVLRRYDDAQEPLASRHAQRIQLDARRCCAIVDTQVIELRPKDFRLLEFLLSHPERVHSRLRLLDEVWGGTDTAKRRTVDVQIRRPRTELETVQCARFIQTMRGSGYRFSTLL